MSQLDKNSAIYHITWALEAIESAGEESTAIISVIAILRELSRNYNRDSDLPEYQRVPEHSKSYIREKIRILSQSLML